MLSDGINCVFYTTCACVLMSL